MVPPPSVKREETPLEIDMDLLLHPYSNTRTSGSAIASYSLFSARTKALADIPVPPPQTITLLPVQYSWPPVSPSNGGSTGVGKVENTDRGMAIDPTLSSVRSSAGGPIPELNLPVDETMASAIESPGLGGAGDVSFDGMGEGSNSADLLGLPEDDKGGSGGKDAPFSRSPELRVSHKLAERKRRKEMKDLFDELRETLPADRGMKASKWEILSKAVDFITHIKTQNHDLTREVESLRRELEMARGSGYRPTQQMQTYIYPQDSQPMFPNIAQATAAADAVPDNGANIGVGKKNPGEMAVQALQGVQDGRTA